MNLRLASVFLDLSEQRLRTLVRQGTIPGAAKNEEGAWAFTKQGLEQYKAEKATSPRRTGGGPRGEGKAWVIRIKHPNYQAVKDFLATLGIELQPRYNYGKQAEYRAKRKAAEKAKKVEASAPKPQSK
jgi:hypothetical protein